jgi:RNA polymerase sigma-70 factor (ECF subfamily)
MKTEKSFLKLYDELAEPLFRHCYFRVSSREIAEDLVQESFMRMWNYLGEGKTIENPKAFLYRVAGNLVIDHYRKKKDTSLDALAEEGFDPAGSGAGDILEYVDGKYAKTLLEKLEPEGREVLVLRYVNDLSIGEIADIIGATENVVSVRIHRSIEKLKKLFNHGQPT